MASLGRLCTALATYLKMDIVELETVQKRVAKIIRELEHLPYKKKAEESGTFQGFETTNRSIKIRC